jgi:hypothetical protein
LDNKVLDLQHCLKDIRELKHVEEKWEIPVTVGNSKLV